MGVRLRSLAEMRIQLLGVVVLSVVAPAPVVVALEEGRGTIG